MSAAPHGGRNPLARRWLLNLALLVLVAALGATLWFRQGAEPEPEAPPLTPLARDGIHAIAIARSGEPDVRLERSDGAWRLTAPIEARVDAFTIDSLLDLAGAPADRPVDAGGEIARFGLAEPALTVRLNRAEIRFGAAHPIEDRRYVLHGSQVYLIPVRFYRAASAPYTNFIDTRLIEPGRKLVALELPGFALALEEDGTWRREPAIDALSSDRINGFIDAWKHARALRVQQYADEPVQDRITLTLAAGNGSGTSEVTVGILSREPELVLYRPDEGLQYHFPGAIEQRLLSLEPEEDPVKSEE